jgi:TolB-like protein
MISLKDCSIRVIVFLLIGLVSLPCLSYSQGAGGGVSSTDGRRFRIAVYPVENLSGTVAPLKEIRQTFIEKLKNQGFDVLEEESFQTFLERNRIRYTGGVDKTVAKAFKEETGTDAILITSVELYSTAPPPKCSLISRLVSTGDDPSILWIDGVGLAGDDAPGFLGLGLIEDPVRLLNNGVDSIMASLARYLSTQRDAESPQGAKKKYQPKILYRSPQWDPSEKITVAVLPFFNVSGRRYAGEIMVLQFIRQFQRFENFNMVEPGVIRQALFRLRLIMDEGVSLSDVDSVSSVLDSDLILSGRVMDYQDYQGNTGTPIVDFSAQLIDRKTRDVVWSSDSRNTGDDGVFFFDRGRVNTAHAIASQMVQAVGALILRKGVK